MWPRGEDDAIISQAHASLSGLARTDCTSRMIVVGVATAMFVARYLPLRWIGNRAREIALLCFAIKFRISETYRPFFVARFKNDGIAAKTRSS